MKLLDIRIFTCPINNYPYICVIEMKNKMNQSKQIVTSCCYMYCMFNTYLD